MMRSSVTLLFLKEVQQGTGIHGNIQVFHSISTLNQKIRAVSDKNTTVRNNNTVVSDNTAVKDKYCSEEQYCSQAQKYCREEQ